MSGFTPGPWLIESHFGQHQIYAKQGPLNVCLATVYSEPDAVLIAAAPDLLAALRGDDAEVPEAIQPLSWLRSAIDALKNPQLFIEQSAEDQDASATMISELEELLRRGLAAVAKATGAAP